MFGSSSDMDEGGTTRRGRLEEDVINRRTEAGIVEVPMAGIIEAGAVEEGGRELTAGGPANVGQEV